MNVELKALLALVFDGIALGEQALAKVSLFTLLASAGQMLIGDLPPVIANWSDLMNEIKALSGSKQEQDLVAYIESRFAGVGNDKAQKILAASLVAIQAGYALEQAIVS